MSKHQYKIVKRRNNLCVMHEFSKDFKGFLKFYSQSYWVIITNLKVSFFHLHFPSQLDSRLTKLIKQRPLVLKVLAVKRKKKPGRDCCIVVDDSCVTSLLIHWVAHALSKPLVVQYITSFFLLFFYSPTVCPPRGCGDVQFCFSHSSARFRKGCVVSIGLSSSLPAVYICLFVRLEFLCK